MRVYHSIWLDPNSSDNIYLHRDMGLTCGAKRIAVAAKGDHVTFAWSGFSIPNSDVCGISHFEFPVVKGKSPSFFQIYNNDFENAVEVSILVEEFGGEACDGYFADEL